MSVRDRLVEIVHKCARVGLSPRRIAQEAAHYYGVACSEADVLLILGNTTPPEVKGDPPAAALDCVIEAHRRLHRAQEGERTAIEAAREAAQAEGKSNLEVANRIAAVEAAFDERISRVIAMVAKAEEAYTKSGGTRDEIDRVLQVHFHTSDAAPSPTPTPGVISD